LNHKLGDAHLIDTPKHLIAIAASKNMAAWGNVSCVTAKKELRLCGAYLADSESRYRPKPPVQPENMHVMIPGMTPAEAMA
jgi:hypothetical protein